MAEEAGKIRVHGKAMNRTVLGIVNAYLTLNPQTTAEELDKAFPLTITPKFAKLESKRATDPYYKYGLFHEIINVDGKRLWAHNNEEVKPSQAVFEQVDETIHTADGKELAMDSSWTEESYKDMVNWAKQHGIEVASFEKFSGGFVKGSYTLEGINGFVSPLLASISNDTPSDTTTETADDNTDKKSCCKWCLITLIILILLILLFLLLRGCDNKNNNNPEATTTEQTADSTATTPDTTAIEQVKDSVIAAVAEAIEKIENKFNAAKFVKGQSKLTDETKEALKELSKTLLDNPKLKLKVIGHSSADGNEAYNQKLSEKRAKAAADFLKTLGVNTDQIEYEGKGSSEPISDDPELNRRTEFVLVEE